MAGTTKLTALFPPPLVAANNLSDLASVAAALTALGLGTTAAAELARIGAAPLASPAFTGVPTTAATPAAGDNSLKLATTAYADRGAAAATAGAAQVDDVRQLMIQVAKLNGKASGFLAGVADSFSDTSGLDTVNSVNAGFDSTNRRITNYDPYTKVLMHFDGASGSAATDVQGHAVTMNQATVSTVQAKFGTASLATGSSSALTVAIGSDWNFANPNGWTVEGWAYETGGYANGAETLFRIGGGGTDVGVALAVNASGAALSTTSGGTGFGTAATGAAAKGQWFKWEVSCDGSSVYFFVAGTLLGTFAKPSFGTSTTLTVGYNNAGGENPWAGYIDEVRVSSNLCRHTASYTPETSALTIANGDMDARSIAYAAQSQPTKASLFLLAKPASGTAITPNTNLLAYASRDGATWTQATLVAAGTLSTGFTAYEANGLDVSGQPAGTSMKWRVRTSGLPVLLQAVVEQWG